MSGENRVDYHAGIVAALKTKYDDQYDFMETLKELILGEKPPRLDAVVLKKSSEQHLDDDIGCFFREHNVFEFKGYGDGICIDDIYKVEGYALFYMTIDRKVGEIPIETVTITVLQYRFPRESLKELEKRDCTIKERTSGIYEVSGGPIIFPLQIVDTVILSEEWDVLKILIPGATEQQVAKIQKLYEETKDNVKKQHLEDVLRTSIESNPELFLKMKEEGKMSEAVQMVFKDEIVEEAEKIGDETIEKMLEDHVQAENIKKWTGASYERIMIIAKKIGISDLVI